jgi:hypothetical protein
VALRELRIRFRGNVRSKECPLASILRRITNCWRSIIDHFLKEMCVRDPHFLERIEPEREVDDPGNVGMRRG